MPNALVSQNTYLGKCKGKGKVNIMDGLNGMQSRYQAYSTLQPFPKKHGHHGLGRLNTYKPVLDLSQLCVAG